MHLVSVCLFLFLVNAQTECESKLQADVDSILATATPGSYWGVSIAVNRIGTQPSQWDTLVGPANNQRQFFTVASATKLLTTSITYEKFGPSATFVTPVVLLNTGGGSTADELCIGASGDPSFNYTQLQKIATALNSKGVNLVKQVSVDTRLYVGAYTPGEWEWGDIGSDYGGLPATTVLNEQLYSVVIAPTSQGSLPLVTYVGPADSSVVDISNQAVTGAKGSTSTLNVDYVPGSATLFVTGSIPQGSSNVTATFSTLTPQEFYTKSLLVALKTAGITTNNWAVGSGACSFNPFAAPPSGAYVLTNLVSDTFDHLLNYTLLESDNLYAEQFLRALGIKYGSAGQNTNSQGLSVVQAGLTALGVDPSLYQQHDGCGLSRHNLISPLALQQLLQGVIQQPWGKAYEALLPVGGESGSLANRFIGTPAQGKVHAKTGTMTGITALSGYVDNSNYNNIVFSIVVNDCPCSASVARNVTDSIVVKLAGLAPC